MDFTDKKLGPFHIKWEIGRGGTAIVYRATDTRSAQEVALKILPPPIATDQTFLKRFIKEGKISFIKKTDLFYNCCGNK